MHSGICRDQRSRPPVLTSQGDSAAEYIVKVSVVPVMLALISGYRQRNRRIPARSVLLLSLGSVLFSCVCISAAGSVVQRQRPSPPAAGAGTGLPAVVHNERGKIERRCEGDARSRRSASGTQSGGNTPPPWKNVTGRVLTPTPAAVRVGRAFWMTAQPTRRSDEAVRSPTESSLLKLGAQQTERVPADREVVSTSRLLHELSSDSSAAALSRYGDRPWSDADLSSLLIQLQELGGEAELPQLRLGSVGEFRRELRRCSAVVAVLEKDQPGAGSSSLQKLYQLPAAEGCLQLLLRLQLLPVTRPRAREAAGTLLGEPKRLNLI
ncbi:uncharacterized protein LOC122380792 [Amphibalanus amphitrite]|uniref:uncharacterized protein LOC122380792 n=1 Tax=Amphibalanus amphitrite TaxID=1232801 RepID=UPI001C900234|nr:uncharacterized protein LOC122380792 [Amphibalanus amphitrite]